MFNYSLILIPMLLSADDNECSFNNGGCQQICTNLDGSFVCDCPDGFVLQANALTCVDVDECRTSVSTCAQLCRNNQGNFTCDCLTGYTLNNDLVTCTGEFCLFSIISPHFVYR